MLKEPNTQHVVKLSEINVETKFSYNDWKVNSDGKTYLDRLEARRPGLPDRLADYNRRVYEATEKAWKEHAPDDLAKFRSERGTGPGPAEFIKQTPPMSSNGTGSYVSESMHNLFSKEPVVA